MVQLKGNGTRGTGPKLASKDLGSAFRSLKKVQKTVGREVSHPGPTNYKKQANKQKVEKSWRKCSKKKSVGWKERTLLKIVLFWNSIPHYCHMFWMVFFVGKLHDDKLAAHKNLVTQGTHSCSSRWETTSVDVKKLPIPKITNGQPHRPLKNGLFQGTIGCTPNSVPMVSIVFSRDSWGL